MVKFGVGQSVRRVEDDRLITGGGRYADDFRAPGQAYMVVVRSPYAHAKILSVDTESAREAPGVLDVLTGQELQEAGLGEVSNAAVALIKQRDGSPAFKTTRHVLAVDRVRHAGDAIAAVIAESEAAARDAAELVMIDFEELPVVVDTEKAADPSSPVIWEEAGSNLAYDWGKGDEDAARAAIANAHHVTKLKLINNRIVVNAMEPRAALGMYDKEQDRYTLHVPSQGVHGLRDRIANDTLKIPPEKLRVITEDVGGGFGMKTFAYPEYPLVLYAAKKLGRPVKWTADRAESFLSDTQGRDHVTEAQLALDADGRILGIYIDTIANLGAYQSQFGAFIPTLAPRDMQAGVYKVPAIYNHVRAVLTNTVPVDAYRGAGRPEASYLIERLMDKAGHETGLGPIEIRRRNFIPAEEMPYNQKPSLPFDSGDFNRNLNDALAKADYEAFEKRRAEKAKDGKLLGLGLCYYVERTAAGMSEFAQLAVDVETNVVHAYTGSQTNGQGHETVWTQFISSRLGLDADQIVVHSGDSDVLPGGAGTGGSKAVYMATGALGVASDTLIEKGKQIAANELEAAVADIEYRGADGEAVFAVVGTDKRIDLFEVARKAEGQTDSAALEAAGEYKEAGNSYPNGAHICEVEIDRDTGDFEITRYIAVDDFGHVINPMIVAGQVHGGIVQGLGQAMGERTVYDEESGQLLTGSFQDYWMPRADDMPFFDTSYNEIPSKNNQLGVKGAGEAGTVGAPSAFINAILDALRVAGVENIDMPVTPYSLWKALHGAEEKAA
jgi:carbon-monoxide dehydrogenase large subunit